MPQRLSVAIVGAGLSGLCLAQALLRLGIDAHVYERDPSPEARRQGYRITIDTHGSAALEECLPPDLFAAVIATASKPVDVAYFRFTNSNLGEIFRLTFRRDPKTSQRQMLGQVDRATLRAIMLSGLEERVHFGMEALRVERHLDSATLHMSDGTARSASVVVAADGIHSTLRGQLAPNSHVIDTGVRGIYGKTPLAAIDRLFPPALERSGVMAIGPPGKAFFFTTMRFNEMPQTAFARLVPDQTPPSTEDYVMWAILLPQCDFIEDTDEQSPVRLSRFATEAARDFHPILRQLVERANTDFLVGTKISAAAKPEPFYAGRAILMGDAIHAMPPTGAHGGNTALRDAALLAKKFQNVAEADKPLDQALEEYQREMLVYAFKEVQQSLSMLKRFNIRNPLARFALLQATPWLRAMAGRGLSLR